MTSGLGARCGSGQEQGFDQGFGECRRVERGIDESVQQHSVECGGDERGRRHGVGAVRCFDPFGEHVPESIERAAELRPKVLVACGSQHGLVQDRRRLGGRIDRGDRVEAPAYADRDGGSLQQRRGGALTSCSRAQMAASRRSAAIEPKW